MSFLQTRADGDCMCAKCGGKILLGESICLDTNDYKLIKHEHCPEPETLEVSAEKIELPWKCPHCGQMEAGTMDELVENFGLRKMYDGTVRNQSWCRRCR